MYAINKQGGYIVSVVAGVSEKTAMPPKTSF